MSEGRLTNIIVPSVFDPYTVVPSIYKSKLYNSGAMILDASLTAKLNGGGLTFNAPFWNDVGGTTGDIPQEGTDATVNALTTGQQVMLRQLREKHWGQNDLSKVEAGESAIDALGNMVNAYYANVYDTAATW